MAIKDYQDAIDLLIAGNLNYEKIVVELVKKNPKLFLSIVTPQREMFAILAKDAWMGDVRNFLSNGQKVEGIKLIRERLGHGLKEAKDIADYAIYIMSPMTSFPPAVSLSTADENIARQIAA